MSQRPKVLFWCSEVLLQYAEALACV